MTWYFPEVILNVLVAGALIGTALGSISLVSLLIRDRKKDEVW